VTDTGSNPQRATSRLRHALPYVLVFAVGLVVLLPSLGDFGFWDPWEPKYAQSVKEMFERDSYIVPYYRDEARLAKPILAYWSIMLGTSIAGATEFGARIGGVLFGLIGALGLCYSVTRVHNQRAGVLAGLVLLTLPQFTALARQATTDVYLLVGLGLSLVFLALAFHTPERRRRHLCLSYLCLAISILAKGPLVSGTVYGATVVVLLAVNINWEYLRSAAVRKVTGSFALVSGAFGIVLIALAAIGSLFVTSPNYWGWDSGVHARLLSIRASSFEVISAWHLTQICLIGGVLATILTAIRWQRSVGAISRRLVIGVCSWVLLLIAASGWVLRLDGHVQVGAACAVSILALIGVYVPIPCRVVRRLDLAERIGPVARFLAQQGVWMVGVLAVVAGPWYMAILIEKSQLFVNDFLVYNHISRATDTINKTAGAEFYWRTILFAFFPWSCLIPAALGMLFYSGRRDRATKTSFESCLLVGCVMLLAAFGSSVTKFSHYIAPMLLPAAALIGITLDRLTRTKFVLARHAAWLIAFVLYLPLASDLLARQGAKHLYRAFTVKSHVPGSMSPNPILTTMVIAIGVALAVALVWNSRWAIAVLIVPTIAFTFYMSAVFTPELSRHKTMKGICESWSTAAPNERTLGFAGPVKHSVFYYCGSRVVELEPSNIERFMDPAQSQHAIIYKKQFNALSRRFAAAHPGNRLHVIDDSHFAYLLVSNHPGARSAN